MYAQPLATNHIDHELLSKLSAAILDAAGGADRFRRVIPPLFRTAIDEVIDAPRTGRMLIEETEKTEKTYLGTKMEILLRDCLGFQKGDSLDLNIAGTDCDIKHTMGTAWSIPSENVGYPAILLREREATALCDFGLINIRSEYLNLGANKDGKKTIAAQHREHIWWLLRDHPYPKNFWLMLSDAQRTALKEAGAPTSRLAALFEMTPGIAIPRSAVEALANQKDPMKRVRRNGGARDILAPKGIAILFGLTDKQVILDLGYSNISSDEFISHIPRNEVEAARLRREGHID